MASEGLNKVQLLGNLTEDPTLRSTANGNAVLTIRLATNESYLDNQRQRQERVEYHSCTVWGKRAEGLAKILSKGSRVFIEGSLRTTSYEAKDGGGKRYKTEINVNNVILCGGGQRGGQQPAPAPRAQTAGGGFDDADYGGSSPMDDLPF